jgi:hypothetical protein
MSKILSVLICGLAFFISCQNSEESTTPEIIIPDPLPEESDNILSEIKLESDGAGNTYELINSILAPNYNVIEAPDCSHEDFGRHIDEVFDAELNKNVFRFKIHVSPDNDRCIKFDRQRNEIKTYDKSPDELKGIKEEKIVYSWKFKLPSNFSSSSKFTHIHQIKAVGGSEDAMPLITLTTRAGSPDNLELRYSETTSQITLKKVDLTPFKGQWVEAVETVIFGEKGVGNYNIEIRAINSENTLFEYSNNNIRMWKTDAEFMRPKWGIYRSLVYAESLKDETVLFADFNIKELKND